MKLALTDVIYKLIAFIVLTPLVGVLFRVLLAASGRTLLADEDILFFFLGPVGWISILLIGALALGIMALEQTALMHIAAAHAVGDRVSVLGALRFAFVQTQSVILLTVRILALGLAASAPFLAAIAAVYFCLLSEFDINYYLSERPPVFYTAAALVGVIGAGWAAVMLRLASTCLFSLPLIVFEDVAPGQALRTSRQRVEGCRKAVVFWLAGWLLGNTLISQVASFVVIFLGRQIVPHAANSITLLTLSVGLSLLVWAMVNLCCNLLSTTSLSVLLFELYQQLGGGKLSQGEAIATNEPAQQIAEQWITRKRLFLAGGVGVVGSVVIGAIVVSTVQTDDATQIAAHRGASAVAPENTMAAVEMAIAAQADWVEIDVQETADGQVVVLHDSDFMKLAGVNLKIWDATWEDLQTIDIGSRVDPKFHDQRTPLLSQVLKTCKGKIGVIIELKYYGHDQQLEQRVVDIVEQEQMQAEVMFMSLKLEAVNKMKSLRPDWKVGWLTSVTLGRRKNINADFYAVSTRSASRSFIESTQKSGREVFVWTINDAPTMSMMIGRGADMLITDKPALARNVLQQRAKMNTPQRLLLNLAAVLGVPAEVGEQ